MFLPKLSVFVILVLASLFLGKSVAAQVPVPPQPVECDDTTDPEFHSLRPYQTSPCGDPPKAIFCGNTLIFTETHNNFPQCENQASGEGKFICHVNRTIGPHELAVNLEGGEFPILGNTQDVKNSQSSNETMDDSEKVNEYVSWYLSGVTDKAEYGQTDQGKIVDYSGPVKKLLPQAIQEDARIKTIETASTEVEILNEVSGETETDMLNHNQIVVCAQEGVLGIWGKTSPHECYEGNGSKAKADVYRLKSWDGDLSALNKILNRIGTDTWNKRIPPLPWEFEDTILYQKAYNEWRGKSCAIILGKLLCIDNPLVRNKWAELFPYIPLASTADKIGKEKINSVSIQPSGGTQITDSSYGEPQSPGLYFAHTQEVKDISESLNKTYTPLDIEISPVSTTEVNDLSACHVLDVRSNQGDDLFPGVENNPKDTLIPDVTYTITEVPCTAKWNSCRNSNNPYCIPGWDVSCEATITIEAKMITKVPWADEIWSQTVADSASTFRKIFPKVEAGAPVECIADLPAATSIEYLPITQPPPRVLNPGDSLSTSPELYFPHIGGVYEYFLKGIQTALRPQGYGGPITNGQYCQSIEPTECEGVADSAVPSKYLGGFKSNFINLSDRWSQKCPGPENNLAEECYNYVASEAMKDGVNPAFALTIWLNESGASNYCEGGDTTQDFGINLSSIYQNIIEQLKAFLGMAKQKLCEGVGGFTEPMHGWLSRFRSSAGVCDPSDPVATQYYIDVRDTTWSWVTGCSSGGKFGITWPTDTSCP